MLSTPLSAFGFTTMRRSVSSLRGQMSRMPRNMEKMPAEPEAPVTGDACFPLVKASEFPYGVSNFKKIVGGNKFWYDKTMYIKQLEAISDHNKIWRPRRFGKSLMCDMLEQFYDKANSKTQVILHLLHRINRITPHKYISIVYPSLSPSFPPSPSLPAPACCSCLLLLPAAPACCSCLLLLPTAPACCSCLLLLPAAPAYCSCLLLLPTAPACCSILMDSGKRSLHRRT
jgi:hypothetical protein